MKPAHSYDDQENFEHHLYQAIASIRSTEEAKLFLSDLCTPNELRALTDRWLVVKLLKQEMPYRQISKETGVSVTTTTRVARCLANADGGYNLLYKRGVKKYDYDKNKLRPK